MGDLQGLGPVPHLLEAEGQPDARRRVGRIAGPDLEEGRATAGQVPQLGQGLAGQHPGVGAAGIQPQGQAQIAEPHLRLVIPDQQGRQIDQAVRRSFQQGRGRRRGAPGLGPLACQAQGRIIGCPGERLGVEGHGLRRPAPSLEEGPIGQDEDRLPAGGDGLEGRVGLAEPTAALQQLGPADPAEGHHQLVGAGAGGGRRRLPVPGRSRSPGTDQGGRDRMGAEGGIVRQGALRITAPVLGQGIDGPKDQHKPGDRVVGVHRPGGGDGRRAIQLTGQDEDGERLGPEERVLRVRDAGLVEQAGRAGEVTLRRRLLARQEQAVAVGRGQRGGRRGHHPRCRPVGRRRGAACQEQGPEDAGAPQDR